MDDPNKTKIKIGMAVYLLIAAVIAVAMVIFVTSRNQESKTDVPQNSVVNASAP